MYVYLIDLEQFSSIFKSQELKECLKIVLNHYIYNVKLCSQNFLLHLNNCTDVNTEW